MSIDPQWGGTDSTGSGPPRVVLTGRQALDEEEITLPAAGYAGQEATWTAETLESVAADARRSLRRRVIGYRGVFTVRYHWLDAGSRKTLARLVNLGGRVLFHPHAEAAPSYPCWITGQSLDTYHRGRAVGYGPCSLTFTTCRLYSGVPRDETPGNFCDALEEAYGDNDAICHFAARDQEYTEADGVAHFSKTEV